MESTRVMLAGAPDTRTLVVEALSLAQRTRTLRPLEKRLAKALAKAFRSQAAAFLNRLRTQAFLFHEAVRNEDWEPLYEAAVIETATLFSAPLVDFAEQAMRLGAQRAIAELMAPLRVPALTALTIPLGLTAPTPAVLDLSFNLTNPRVAAYLREVGADRVTGINETTRVELRKILVRASEEGWSYQRTAREISGRYRDFAGPPLRGGPKLLRTRAELVAVTEIGEAYTEAGLIMARELEALGGTVEKSWLAPANPCPVCAPNPGAGWIPLDRAFPSGHHRPLGHPGCRCALLTRSKPANRRAA